VVAAPGRRRLGLLAILLAAGCAGGGTSASRPPDAAPPPPDAQALERATVVTAGVVKLVLSERWRREARVQSAGENVQAEEGSTVVTYSGPAQLKLMSLEVSATKQLRITWLGPEHDNILLHATEVVAFRQMETFQHSTENVSAVTMANDVVRYWQQ